MTLGRSGALGAGGPRVGLVARSEWRGLGVQTRSFFEGYGAHRVLLVGIAGNPLGYDRHPEWYPGARRVRFDPGEVLTPTEAVADFASEVDVVFSAETLYDWRAFARSSTPTAVQVNPELYRHGSLDLPHPTRWWLPTPWRAEHLPDGPLVPVPIPPWIVTAFPEGDAPTDDGGPLRVLHVIGHRAAGDRNGSGIVQEAIPHITQPTVLTIACQDGDRHVIPSTRNVEVRQVGMTEDPADLYRGQDVLCSPRRYGGLHLPAIEAMGAGLAVVMSATSPQDDLWPVLGVPGSLSQHLSPGGTLHTTNVEPADLAHALDSLAADREGLACWQERSRRWARENTWAALAPLYRRSFEAVG